MSRYEKISILAGGWSASHHNVKDLPGFVLGVNDAIVYGRCDAGVSMDRLWFENRWSFLLKYPLPFWTRMATIKQKYMLPIPPWMTICDCDYKTAKMSDDCGVLNGTNSGLFAVNVAYQLRPSELFIFGMDGTLGPRGETHWYGDYSFKTGKGTSPGTYSKWQCDLSLALKQCQNAGIEIRIMK